MLRCAGLRAVVVLVQSQLHKVNWPPSASRQKNWWKEEAGDSPVLKHHRTGGVACLFNGVPKNALITFLHTNTRENQCCSSRPFVFFVCCTTRPPTRHWSRVTTHRSKEERVSMRPQLLKSAIGVAGGGFTSMEWPSGDASAAIVCQHDEDPGIWLSCLVPSQALTIQGGLT